MTTPNVPPVDAGNTLLGETPSVLSTAVMDTPGGQRLALTIRTPSTTLTVLLGRDDARSWHGALGQGVDQMTVSGLILAPAGAVPMNGQQVPQ